MFGGAMFTLVYLSYQTAKANQSQSKFKDMDVFEQLQRLTSQLAYTVSVLSLGGLQAWEAKELSQVAKTYEQEIKELNDHILKYNLK